MRLVIHSVLNRTGAARYLREQLLVGEPGTLVTWAPPAEAPPGWQVISLTATNVEQPGWRRSWAWLPTVLLQQFIFVIRHRKSYTSIDINSASNLGAIIAAAAVPRSCTCRLYVHETPVGKWKWVLAAASRVFSGVVITVSPYAQSELRGMGIGSSWAYPRAFLGRKPMDADPSQKLYDVLVAAHPDRSKGYDFIMQMLHLLPASVQVVLYLSRPAAVSRPLPPNVFLVVGKTLSPEDYSARMCVLATDPTFVKETFGYIVADSIAAGVPVLCSPSGGVSEQLIHGVNAWFSAEYSPAAFAAEITHLLGNPPLLEGLKEGANLVARLKRANLEDAS
jgi:glycosyltransferase involved in cell wall biosynthesis